MRETYTPLSREELQGLDQATLLDLVLAMQAQMEVLAAEIQRLRDQVAKDSHNSGKPPSSDGMKKGRRESLRERGKRASGGQVGHVGHTLEAVAQPDRIVRHEVEVCPHCQTDLRQVVAVGMEKRQVFDVPPARLEVSEHQAAIKTCPGCGERVKAPFPAGISQAVQYGARLQGLMVYLNSYHLLPLARTSEILGAIYGQAPSQAAIVAANQRVAAGVEVSIEGIRQHLKHSRLLHADETGGRVQGRLRWLHVLSTDQVTLYGLHDKRSQVAMRAMGILPEFQGWVVHDAFVSYWQFSQCRHALCNAHHLRELRFLTEQYQQGWAEELAQLLLTMHRLRVTGETLSDECRHAFEQRYDDLLARGLAANPPLPPTGQPGRPKRSPAQNLLERFRRFKDAVLPFWRDPLVPFDNNLAERDLRMLKLQQKISGCFRTPTGADTFCRIRSYLSTARKHQLNLLDALASALAGSPFIPPPLPDTS